MTVQELITLLTNVRVDYDGYYGDQCVDLAQVFNRLYKAPFLSGASAKDIWNTYPKDFYDRIANAPDNFPQEGDLIIWGTGLGPDGHIAIATKDADINRFKSFDQNFPFNSACHLQEHNYTGVLGWLRPKKKPQDQQTLLDQLKKERDTLKEKINKIKAILDS
jgi:CHAP domain-containing protein